MYVHVPLSISRVTHSFKFFLARQIINYLQDSLSMHSVVSIFYFVEQTTDVFTTE